jgi:transposase-like protein
MENSLESAGPRAPSTAWRKTLEELLAFYDSGHRTLETAAHHQRDRRTLCEVRRRIRTMCAFITPTSCERILFSVFDRMNTHWRKHPLKTFTQNN